MSEHVRNLLDQLMGVNRDLTQQHQHKNNICFKSADVCKSFLLGFCPYDLFRNNNREVCNGVRYVILYFVILFCPYNTAYIASYIFLRFCINDHISYALLLFTVVARKCTILDWGVNTNERQKWQVLDTKWSSTAYWSNSSLIAIWESKADWRGWLKGK